jgi:hypothetical protein
MNKKILFEEVNNYLEAKKKPKLSRVLPTSQSPNISVAPSEDAVAGSGKLVREDKPYYHNDETDINYGR